ncbi:MAG TPA: hypothetical protein VKE98_13895 [Gemmataceae bacterium]|nr:hypothetical protein [Gemmataceae bacterium]
MKTEKNTDRWLLEYDSEGEIYTSSDTDESRIKNVLHLFNGSTTFYCCLSDNTDESCLWCVGEPDRRMIEGRLFENKRLFHFVIRRKSDAAEEAFIIRCGMEPNETIRLTSAEILSRSEAIRIFTTFYEGKTIPDDFFLQEKVCLFGSLSFKDEA